MLIEIKEEDFLKIHQLLINNKIEHKAYDNHYWAVCREEIDQAINCYDSMQEDITFNDIVEKENDDIIYSLTDELYNSNEANSSFQELAETAQLIVNRKVHNLRGE